MHWLVVGAAVLAAGVPFAWNDQNDDRGWVGMLPPGLSQVLLGACFVLSAYVFLVGGAWLMRMRFGRESAMVQFSRDRVAFRSPLLPLALVVQRDEIVGVWVRHFRPRGLIRSRGKPIVMTKLRNGKLRGVADYFEGTAEALADDLIRWSGAQRLDDEHL